MCGVLCMQITSYDRNGCGVIKVAEDVTLQSDLSPLIAVVDAFLNKGIKRIAVSFTRNSYLYTSSLAVLINCYEMIRDCDGELYFFDVNPGIIDVFSVVGLSEMVKIYASENDLP
jgi:anti-anti-sigma factor